MPAHASPAPAEAGGHLPASDPALGRAARGGARQPRARTKQAAGAALACGAVVLAVYVAGLAPGLTWAHHAADGGDLLAAAASNGVPHPPGYPLYTQLLRSWLAIGERLAPASEPAWWGNLFSALCAAAAVTLTVWTLAHLLLPDEARGAERLHPAWAALGGLLWGLGPQLWSQAVVTEVYTLHALGVALLAWAALTPGPAMRLLPGAFLATSHHPTLVLLLPAALYGAVWATPPAEEGGALSSRARLGRVLGWAALGSLLGISLHLRTLWVARAAPPVNWGFADSWSGLWWLVSGAAYGSNLLAGGAAVLPARLGAWLGTILREVAWVGLLPLLAGLAWLDGAAPRLRTATLLWFVPPSAFALLYMTRDSQVNLLAASWVAALWVAVGLQQIARWAVRHPWKLAPRLPAALAVTAALWLAVVAAVRWPALSLRHDEGATLFLAGAATVLQEQPNTILISRADAETFAVWYGTWAAHEPLAPGLLPVNDALYQFAWYRRLMATRAADVPGVDESAQALVAQNAGVRPIYFTEPLEWAAPRLVAEPPLWRFVAATPTTGATIP